MAVGRRPLRYPDRAVTSPAPASAPPRRRVEIVLAVAVAAIFVVQLAALALGQTVLAAVCAVLLITSWFVFRSVMKRRGA